MKKIYLLFAIALLVASCDDSTNDINMKVINLTVASSDWVAKTDNNGNTYYAAHFSMPEITSFVYTDGTVIGYIDLNGVQMTLPYVTHNKNSLGQLWTETVDYDYSVG